MRRRSLLHALVLTAAMSACSPTYIDQGEGESGWLGFNEVKFQVHDAYKAAPPDCVAILPLSVKTPSQPMATAEDAAKVRLSLYAHLAIQSKREIKLERVDRVLKETGGDRKAMAERLHCPAFIEGEITEYGSMFLALYSRVAVGLELKMVRAADGVVLWRGSHTASSHGGALPLDPVGVAMGLADAASNVRDEQILRVTDDIARRLVSTIPDDKVAALDDPVAEPIKAAPAEQAAVPEDPVAAGERLLAQGDHEGALAAADRAVAADPDNARGHFLKGRVLMIEGDHARAEPAILKAVALDRANAGYLNALGAVNARKGATERALAAYGMAIEADPANGFAYYNTAIIHYNAGAPRQAADAFYGAGLAYIKTGDYARAEKALGDLHDLAKAGIPVDWEIATIKEALARKLQRLDATPQSNLFHQFNRPVDRFT